MPILDSFKLDGKVALVTGGNRGLGRQMALALAEAGANVAITSRSIHRAEEVAQSISEATGRKCVGYACDVANPSDVESMMAQLIDEFGGIHIVVNNAGINIRGPIDQLTLAEFQEVLDTNVTGMWLVCRAAAPYLKEQRYGRVINIGSTLSIIAIAERTPYASSKGAVLQMTRALALEWAPYGITVNAMLPGPFATEMNTSLVEDPVAYQSFIQKVPLGRWGELHEIGGLAVFLASDASSFVTGAGISIDGGWTVM
ncbi:glucose 1-dehydrogenase [bacterium]|nr:glucose 1-dehydrogenase [bacterium]